MNILLALSPASARPAGDAGTAASAGAASGGVLALPGTPGAAAPGRGAGSVSGAGGMPAPFGDLLRDALAADGAEDDLATTAAGSGYATGTVAEDGTPPAGNPEAGRTGAPSQADDDAAAAAPWHALTTATPQPATTPLPGPSAAPGMAWPQSDTGAARGPHEEAGAAPLAATGAATGQAAANAARVSAAAVAAASAMPAGTVGDMTGNEGADAVAVLPQGRLAARQPAVAEGSAAALERAVAAPPAGVANAAVSAATTEARDSASVAETTVKLPNGEPSRWREPLAQALGDRLQVQISRGSERAVIRLDPPMMGSVEIVVRHEGGALQVHLSATHGEVLRQLQALGETLRQDPALRQFAEVGVQVSDGSRDGDGRQRSRQDQTADAPGRALAEAQDGQEGEDGQGGHSQARFSLTPERG